MDEQVCGEALQGIAKIHMSSAKLLQKKAHKCAKMDGTDLTGLESCVQVCGNSAKVQLNMGILERRYQNWDEALHHFTRARSIEPTYCETRYWIGITLAAQQNLPQAIPVITISAPLWPSAYTWTYSSRPAACQRLPAIALQWIGVSPRLFRLPDSTFDPLDLEWSLWINLSAWPVS